MRRTTLALLLLMASGSLTPSQAQWWGGGWARPCFGGCGPWVGRPGGWAGRFVVVEGAPRPFWGGFGPPRFRPAGWGWRRPWWWWREQRRRRFEARLRWLDAAARDERPAAPKPWRFRGWAWQPRAASPPDRTEPVPASVAAKVEAAPQAEPAVAMLPPTSPHLAPARATPLRRVLAAAAMIRPIPTPAPRPTPVAPAVVRVPGSPARVREPRPALVALRRPHVVAAPSPPVRPAALRNEPVQQSPAAPQPASPPPATPQPEVASPADVPVAPLD